MNDSITAQRRYLAIAVVVLLCGLFLYLFPEIVATLPAPDRSSNSWPWPIGPLALRFIASLLIAAALGIYLVSRRPDLPSVTAFFTIATIFSSLLLLHSLINVTRIDWTKPLSMIWVGALVLAFLGSVLLVVRQRRRLKAASPTLPPTPRTATRIALSIFVLTGLVGGIMFFLPNIGLVRWPWNLGNTVNVQLLGVVFLGVSLSALWSWRQPSWYGYDLFYPAAGTFATAALLASFIHWNLFADRPITSWVFVVAYILGAVLGYYPYLQYSFRKYERPPLTR